MAKNKLRIIAINDRSHHDSNNIISINYFVFENIKIDKISYKDIITEAWYAKTKEHRIKLNILLNKI